MPMGACISRNGGLRHAATAAGLGPRIVVVGYCGRFAEGLCTSGLIAYLARVMRGRDQGTRISACGNCQEESEEKRNASWSSVRSYRVIE